MKLKLSISPCPNDTFMFDAMVNGRIDTEGLEFDLTFADIEELNREAANSTPHVSKISCAVLPLIADKYRVLNSGSALGRGNGPLLVSRREVVTTDSSLRVAVPGEHTTANLLLRKLFPALTDRTPVLFSEIADRVAADEFDAGVLIHEGRFTFADKGLRLVADLGKEWERVSGMPLPLGSIAISRDLPEELQRKVSRVLGRSVEYAMANPSASAEFVRSHAQEISDEVTRSHIELFVNQYSIDLGTEGRAAICSLTGLAEEGLFV